MYSYFAENYDNLMQDVNYKERSDYIVSLFKQFDKKPSLLLDLACGTGGFSLCLADNDTELIGVDISPEMLSIAKQKAKKEKKDILFLMQDMTELDLYGTVDGAICCLDSLNHITDYEDFCTALAKVSLFLEKGRLFIFDVNTPYKHKKVLGDNTFILESEDIFCVWQNEYYKKDALTEITLDFFKAKENGKYERQTEEFCERAYSKAQIKAALKKAGLKIEAILDDLSCAPLKAHSERAIYVARKI